MQKKTVPIRGMLLLTAGAAAVVIGMKLIRPHYSFGIPPYVENCLPYKLYFLDHHAPKEVRRGDLVQFTTEKMDGYFLHNTMMVKQVAAVPGDTVEVRNDQLFINGQPSGKLILHAKLHAKPGQFDRKEVLQPGQYYVLGTHPQSYDSRYWGSIGFSNMHGVAYGLF